MEEQVTKVEIEDGKVEQRVNFIENPDQNDNIKVSATDFEPLSIKLVTSNPGLSGNEVAILLLPNEDSLLNFDKPKCLGSEKAQRDKCNIVNIFPIIQSTNATQQNALCNRGDTFPCSEQPSEQSVCGPGAVPLFQLELITLSDQNAAQPNSNPQSACSMNQNTNENPQSAFLMNQEPESCPPKQNDQPISENCNNDVPILLWNNEYDNKSSQTNDELYRCRMQLDFIESKLIPSLRGQLNSGNQSTRATSCSQSTGQSQERPCNRRPSCLKTNPSCTRNSETSIEESVACARRCKSMSTQRNLAFSDEPPSCYQQFQSTGQSQERLSNRRQSSLKTNSSCTPNSGISIDESIVSGRRCKSMSTQRNSAQLNQSIDARKNQCYKVPSRNKNQKCAHDCQGACRKDTPPTNTSRCSQQSYPMAAGHKQYSRYPSASSGRSPKNNRNNFIADESNESLLYSCNRQRIPSVRNQRDTATSSSKYPRGGINECQRLLDNETLCNDWDIQDNPAPICRRHPKRYKHSLANCPKNRRDLDVDYSYAERSEETDCCNSNQQLYNIEIPKKRPTPQTCKCITNKRFSSPSNKRSINNGLVGFECSDSDMKSSCSSFRSSGGTEEDDAVQKATFKQRCDSPVVSIKWCSSEYSNVPYSSSTICSTQSNQNIQRQNNEQKNDLFTNKQESTNNSNEPPNSEALESNYTTDTNETSPTNQIIQLGNHPCPRLFWLNQQWVPYTDPPNSVQPLAAPPGQVPAGSTTPCAEATNPNLPNPETEAGASNAQSTTGPTTFNPPCLSRRFPCNPMWTCMGKSPTAGTWPYCCAPFGSAYRCNNKNAYERYLYYIRQWEIFRQCIPLNNTRWDVRCQTRKKMDEARNKVLKTQVNSNFSI